MTHAQVGFNPETRAIGIRAADASVQARYRLRQQSTRSQGKPETVVIRLEGELERLQREG